MFRMNSRLNVLERFGASSPTKKYGGNFGGNYFFVILMLLFSDDISVRFGGRHLHQIIVPREHRKAVTPNNKGVTAFFIARRNSVRALTASPFWGQRLQSNRELPYVVASFWGS